MIPLKTFDGKFKSELSKLKESGILIFLYIVKSHKAKENWDT